WCERLSPSDYLAGQPTRSVADKVQLCALPDAIYKAYLHVLPKKSRKGIPHIEEIIPVAENGSAQLTMDINN
ncbi:MAG: hypothetical protein ABI855_12885, partial [Bacteroidota bacterium]